MHTYIKLGFSCSIKNMNGECIQVLTSSSFFCDVHARLTRRWWKRWPCYGQNLAKPPVVQDMPIKPRHRVLQHHHLHRSPNHPNLLWSQANRHGHHQNSRSLLHRPHHLLQLRRPNWLVEEDMRNETERKMCCWPGGAWKVEESG